MFFVIKKITLSLAKRIASSTFSQVFAKFLIAGLSIVSVKLVTNYLGVEGYGRYGIIYEMMAFSSIVADFGLFHIALREIGKDLSKIKKILSNIISMRLTLSIFASLTTLAIVWFFTDYETATVKIGLMIALGTATIGLMGTTITAVLQVHLRMTYAAVVQIIGKIAMIIYIWHAIKLDLGFLHMLWAGLLGSCIIVIMTYIYAIRFSEISFRFDWDVWKHLLKESYPMGLALIFYNVALRAPILMLDGIVKNPALTGMYTVAQRIIEILIFVPIAFMNSVLPTMSRFIDEKTEQATKKLHSLVQHSFDFLNAISLPLIAGGIILAPEIIKIISKEEFVKSAYIFQILIGMIFFYYLSTFFGYLLFAYNQQMLYMKSNMWAAIATVVCGIFVTAKFAEYGALSAHILAEVVSMGVSFYYLRKFLSKKISFNSFFRVLAATVLMFVSLYYLKGYLNGFGDIMTLIISMGIGGFVYLSGLVLFKALPFQELYTYILKR